MTTYKFDATTKSHLFNSVFCYLALLIKAAGQTFRLDLFLFLAGGGSTFSESFVHWFIIYLHLTPGDLVSGLSIR